MLQDEVIREIEELIGETAAEAIDFEAIETAVRREALRLAAHAVEQKLNADHSDYCGPQMACACGAMARYAGRIGKTITSVLGKMTLERAYYDCAICERGFFPRDGALKIEGCSLSPAVTRMTGSVGALVSFEEGAELLGELAGIAVHAKQVERSAEKLGQEISQDERNNFDANAGELAPTLYLGMDGTGIPMRTSELKDRPGKQPDGSAKTREVKLCTIWSAEQKDENGIPVRDEGSVSYSAAIESAAMNDLAEGPSEFAQRVLREASRRGFQKTTRRVVLGDGAPWIWNLADEYFSDAIQIIDRFHVKQHLSDVAKAVYGVSSEFGAVWAKKLRDDLDEGKLDEILSSLAPHVANCDDARKCATYIRENSNRMQYAKFRAQGLCTSTGVVESGCKVTIGTRLKRAGMHWTLPGANAIIALRCCKLSRRFEDFWERRANIQT